MIAAAAAIEKSSFAQPQPAICFHIILASGHGQGVAKMGEGKIVVCEQDMFKSKAFRTMPATAIVILLDFLMRRRIKKCRILNNGEIEYCFSEAQKKGIPPATFNRNRDILIERGFLEVTHAGSGGKKGDKTLYALVNRWKNWGKESFKRVERPKDLRKGVGFAAHHQKKSIGNASDTRTTVTGDT